MAAVFSGRKRRNAGRLAKASRPASVVLPLPPPTYDHDATTLDELQLLFEFDIVDRRAPRAVSAALGLFPGTEPPQSAQSGAPGLSLVPNGRLAPREAVPRSVPLPLDLPEPPWQEVESEISSEVPDLSGVALDDADSDGDAAGAIDVLALAADESAAAPTVWDLEFGEIDPAEERHERRRPDRQTELPGRIERRARALQQAHTVALSAGIHSPRAVAILQDIFDCFGWASCKRVVLAFLRAGRSIDEIHLAFRLRLLWTTQGYYSASVIEQAGWREAANLNLSWPGAFRLIDAFNGVPELAEVEVLLDDEFARWSSSPSLRATFVSFRHYLDACRLDDSGRFLHPLERRDFEGIGLCAERPDWDDWSDESLGRCRSAAEIVEHVLGRHAFSL